MAFYKKKNNDNTRTKQTEKTKPIIVTTTLWKRIPNNGNHESPLNQQKNSPRKHYVPNEMHYIPPGLN